MKSPLQTFTIIFLSIVICALLFNKGTVTDTVKDTYHKYLEGHNTTSYSNPSPDSSLPSTSTATSQQALPSIISRPHVKKPELVPAPEFRLLSALCANTTFSKGLYLHCHSFGGPFNNANNGGLSNARNRYQTCLRLAIDAGANVALAPLMQRDNHNLQNTNWRQVGPEAMIDVEDLISTMKETCPGMAIKSCPNGTCGNTTLATTENGGEYDFVLRTPDHDHKSGAFSMGTFRKHIDETIIDKTNGTFSHAEISDSDNKDKKVKIEFGDVFMAWNYTTTHESSLKKELFQIVKFNTTLLSLGAAVHAAALNATRGNDFVGIHFRGEGDWPSNVCNASTQIQMYGRELAKWNRWRWSKLRDIYLSCGDLERVQMFREAIEPQGFRVHDKHSLLNTTYATPEQKEVLGMIDGLNFDQKAVVEFVTLKSSTKFLGLLPSTLSYIVAYERTLNKQSKWWKVEGEEDRDWFDQHILQGTWRGEGLSKHWPKPIEMRGDGETKLLVIDGQSELSDSFP